MYHAKVVQLNWEEERKLTTLWVVLKEILEIENVTGID